MSHLPILPILLPLVAGALMLVLERRGIVAQRVLAAAAMLALSAVAVWLAVAANDGAVAVYLVGDWPARLGIALAVDRLTGVMLVSTSVLACLALLYAFGGWDRRAPHFHAFFQFQLAGLNGAYLTADLFNLFVFFEVLLIASYGLMLSGGRGPRMRAGMHYVAFNVMASLLFLVAVALLYGVLGALNMAELAARIRDVPPESAGLVRAAGGLLLVVFCAKAALVPMYFWLPDTYRGSPAPVAALFAIMTKLGVYAVLRVYTLIFGADAGPAAGLAWPWLLPAGAATLALATVGVLAARDLRRFAGYLIIASAATLFVAVSLARAEAIGAALYYLVHSALVGGALFLVADQVRRLRPRGRDSLTRLDRLSPKALVGIAFMLAGVSLAGLPPLSGFVGKLGILAAMRGDEAGWLWPLILITSLLTVVAFARAGSQLFWRERGDEEAFAGAQGRTRAVEAVPIVGLLALGVLLALLAAPALRYTDAAARQLLAPQAYIDSVRGALPSPSRQATPAADAYGHASASAEAAP